MCVPQTSASRPLPKAVPELLHVLIKVSMALTCDEQLSPNSTPTYALVPLGIHTRRPLCEVVVTDVVIEDVTEDVIVDDGVVVSVLLSVRVPVVVCVDVIVDVGLVRSQS